MPIYPPDKSQTGVNMRLLFGGISAVILAVSLFAPAQAADTRTLAVQGNGSVRVEPDIAQVSAGVITQAKTAADALSQNSAFMAQLFETTQNFGVPKEDMRTTRVTLSPRYSNRQNAGVAREIVGYQAQNTLAITLRNLDKVGSILDVLSKAGANTISNITFSLSDPTEVLNQARQKAVADAAAKAQLYATAAGVTLGPVLSIQEPNARPNPGPVAFGARSAEAVPIAQGTLEVSAQINIIYAIE